MHRQWWMVGVIMGVIILLVGGGWFFRDLFLPVEVGQEAPNFQATDLAGNPVQLAELRGEVVLLNIWATWCPPCREEMPSMQRLEDMLGPRGLKIIAVSIDAPIGFRDPGGRPGGDVAAFGEEMGLTFPLWLDPEGGIQQAYSTTGVPESFVIDRQGTIVRKVLGPVDWDSPANIELFERLLDS